MRPTLSQVYTQVRATLGDDQVAGGEIFTDTVLQPFALQSIRELWRVLRGAQDPFVLKEGYFVLPAQTAVFDPAIAGMSDMPEPEYVEWQVATTVTPITNVVVSGANATVTATGHGLAIGTFPTVVTYNIGGFEQFNNPNGLWVVNVVDANTIRLNGCNAAGAYTSGGSLTAVPKGQFTPMAPRDRIEAVIATPAMADSTGAIYAWEGGVFRFLASSQDRLLKVTYRGSANVSSGTSVTIPIDDSLDFLSTRTAGLAAATREAGNRSLELALEAIGPGGVPDGNGGLLGQLLRADIRNMQRIQYRRPPFRARRNAPSTVLY